MCVTMMANVSATSGGSARGCMLRPESGMNATLRAALPGIRENPSLRGRTKIQWNLKITSIGHERLDGDIAIPNAGTIRTTILQSDPYEFNEPTHRGLLAVFGSPTNTPNLISVSLLREITMILAGRKWILPLPFPIADQ